MSAIRVAALLALGAGTLMTAPPAIARDTPAERAPATRMAPIVTVGDVLLRLLPAVAAPPPPAPAFLCPVQGPVSFVDSWGNARSGGRRHEGVDMLSPHGTPVVAPVGGTVEHRGNSTGGLSFHLYGDDGVYYYGTHLSGYGASERVEQGAVVGYVGDTGNARGTPHLHFEIHPGGEGAGAVNPYPTVAAHC